MQVYEGRSRAFPGRSLERHRPGDPARAEGRFGRLIWLCRPNRGANSYFPAPACQGSMWIVAVLGERATAEEQPPSSRQLYVPAPAMTLPARIAVKSAPLRRAVKAGRNRTPVSLV